MSGSNFPFPFGSFEFKTQIQNITSSHPQGQTKKDKSIFSSSSGKKGTLDQQLFRQAFAQALDWLLGADSTLGHTDDYCPEGSEGDYEPSFV